MNSTNCSNCGTALKPLFNFSYCPNDCDKPKSEKVVAPNKKWYGYGINSVPRPYITDDLNVCMDWVNQYKDSGFQMFEVEYLGDELPMRQSNSFYAVDEKLIKLLDEVK